jgi:tRNA A-37 threonylcarbamoyl transferase component Bud32
MQRFLTVVNGREPSPLELSTSLGIPNLTELQSKFGLGPNPSTADLIKLHSSLEYIDMVRTTTSRIMSAACVTIRNALPKDWIPSNYSVTGIRGAGSVGVVIGLVDRARGENAVLKIVRQKTTDFMTVDDEERVQRLMYRVGVAPPIKWHKRHEELHGLLTGAMAISLDIFLKCMKSLSETDRASVRESLVMALKSIMTRLKSSKFTHGDMHPHNIMLTATGRALLIDFGQSSCHTNVPAIDVAQLIRTLRSEHIVIDRRTLAAIETMLFEFAKIEPNDWLSIHTEYARTGMGCTVDHEKQVRVPGKTELDAIDSVTAQFSLPLATQISKPATVTAATVIADVERENDTQQKMTDTAIDMLVTGEKQKKIVKEILFPTVTKSSTTVDQAYERTATEWYNVWKKSKSF